MILFHGSNVPVETIDLALSKPNKDFGRAFYLSTDKEQAEVMASFKAELLRGELSTTMTWFMVPSQMTVLEPR